VSDGNVEHLSVSNRDDDEMRAGLTAWLGTRPEVGSGLRIEDFSRPETNGMSSETLLFDASWTGGGGRYVARLRPAASAYPIFPTYDLERQARVMQLIGAGTAAPVPAVHWYEPSESALGTPFFVMDRVDGEVPPDVMPYPFDDTWVSNATPDQRAHMQARTVEALAAIHGLDAGPDEVAFLRSDGASGSALRAHFEAEKAYYDWVRGDLRYPVLDRAFTWLEDHWPTAADAGPTVVNWGDARIGNILYRDFEPRAILDWEMAALGPRELDLGWFIFLHRFFQDIATQFELAGLPDFLERHEVTAQYTAASGHEPRDLDWFLTYAALRHGTVMIRAVGRSVHLGERPAPDDHEELVMHRAAIDALVAGTYWSSLT
jgi:aminoglycoside phosphotransferase (APT) family kinase protein